jgi:pyruvate kinase
LTVKANSIATKIVCTIGPASDSTKILTQLVQSGMDVARINFSHGTYDQDVRTIKTIRQVSERLKRPVAILQDLPGPKLRVGKLATEPLHLERLDKISLTTTPTSSKSKIPVAYPDLPRAVRKGDSIFLADGTIRIEVLRTRKDEVEGRVINGGDLTSGKGVNLPRLRIRVPAITSDDKEHIKFGVENNVDIIAVSFVQKVDDVRTARKVAEANNRKIFVVAKIEKREAVDNLEEIVREADGIMVARGDLGVELKLELVPIIQKRIIHESNRFGKPVITATQMLESMVSSPTPTRAEVTDVANAIIDGTDAVMLSEETAIGKYPAEAVKILGRVAEETERFLPKEISAQRRAWYEHSQADALALGACETALQVSASAIVAPTRTGRTARLVSKYRPPLPIIALTSHPEVQRQLLLSWGVQTLLTREFNTSEEIFREAEKTIVGMRLAGKRGRIVIIAGDPKGPSGKTEILKVQTIN